MNFKPTVGNVIGVICWVAAVVKMTGIFAVKFGAPELFLCGLLAVALFQ